jgi:hypothetical protein
VLVRDGGRRLVPHPPAGGDQPPHQVDVLGDPHRLVEAVAERARRATIAALGR